MIEVNPTMLEGLEEVRRQSLETDVVSVIASKFDLPAVEAMRLYFSSRLCREIEAGEYGIQYLDAAYLVDDLVINEPELFERLFA